MTMVRTSETRFAEFAEFEDMEGENPMWRISPERMKMRSEHLVQVPRQAVALYRELKELNVYSAAGNMRVGREPLRVPISKSLEIRENRMIDIMLTEGYRGQKTDN